jgi:hypothetical protein
MVKDLAIVVIVMWHRWSLGQWKKNKTGVKG